MGLLPIIKKVAETGIPIGLAATLESRLMTALIESNNFQPLKVLAEPVLNLGLFSVSKAVALVALINVLGTSVSLMYMAVSVGGARNKYKVFYPDMYAKGDDEDSKKFNCVQRGHQQALEIHPSFVFSSLIAGLRHPLTTTLAGALWIASRIRFFNNYANLGAEKRYDFLSRQHWNALAAVFILATSTSLGLLNIV